MHKKSICFLRKDFHQPLLKITSFCRFSWKRDKFELQVPRNLLMIFGKIIFRYTTAYFNIDTPRVSEYTTPSYELSCPPSWLCLEIGWKNSRKFKNTLSNARPSPGVITNVLLSTNNNKLGIRQFCWKFVHKKELSAPNILGFLSK